MNKKDLKKQIEDIAKQIKANSKDAKFAEKLVDKLLSLKGQYDVEATRIHIREKDVVKEYDFEAVRFIRCKGCIIFHAKGGVTTIVKPTMKCLYEHLDVLLDMKDRYEELKEEEKKAYEALYTATLWNLSASIYSTLDDELFVNVATDIMKRFEVYIQSKESELQDETPEENAEFETKMGFANELLKENADSK